MSEEYRSARRRAWVAIFGVAASATAHVMSVLAFNLVLRFYPDVEAKADAGDLGALAIMVVIAWGALVSIGAMVLAGVAFLAWLHRVVKNTRLHFGIRSLPSPAGAVVVWFIPIISLFRPFGVMTQVYKANHVDGKELDSDWVRKMPWIMPVWWFSWLFNIFFEKIGKGDGDDLIHAYSWPSLLGVPFTVVSGLGAIAVVLSVQARQEAMVGATVVAPREFEPPVRAPG